jgi:hypothetical protein
MVARSGLLLLGYIMGQLVRHKVLLILPLLLLVLVLMLLLTSRC